MIVTNQNWNIQFLPIKASRHPMVNLCDIINWTLRYPLASKGSHVCTILALEKFIGGTFDQFHKQLMNKICTKEYLSLGLARWLNNLNNENNFCM
jgi:hypothetical protein